MYFIPISVNSMLEFIDGVVISTEWPQNERQYCHFIVHQCDRVCCAKLSFKSIVNIQSVKPRMWCPHHRLAIAVREPSTHMQICTNCTCPQSASPSTNQMHARIDDA